MRKMTSLLLAAGMTMALLSGCGGGTERQKSKPQQPQTTAAETKAEETTAAESKEAETKAAEVKGSGKGCGDGAHVRGGRPQQFRKGTVRPSWMSARQRIIRPPAFPAP